MLFPVASTGAGGLMGVTGNMVNREDLSIFREAECSESEGPKRLVHLSISWMRVRVVPWDWLSKWAEVVLIPSPLPVQSISQ